MTAGLSWRSAFALRPAPRQAEALRYIGVA